MSIIGQLVDEIDELLEKKTRSAISEIGKWQIMENNEPDGTKFPMVMVRDIGFSENEGSVRYTYIDGNWVFSGYFDELLDNGGENEVVFEKYQPKDFHIWKAVMYDERLPNEDIIKKVKQGKTGGKAIIR